MQIDKIFSTQFVDPTTRTPITDLTGVTITILEIASDGTTASVPVSNASCANGTLGFYRYYFAGMEDKIYEFYFNPNDARVQITAGFVDKRLNNLDKAISEIVTGGGSGNMTWVTSSISSLRTLLTKKIEDEHIKTRELIVTENNDTNSHIELAKSNVIDTIKEIEIPESKLEEKETKKAIKLITTLDKKLTSYIESETKEKEEIGTIAREFTRIEMEDEKKKKEKELNEKKMEEESDKKLLEEIQKEFDSQEEQEKEEKKKELEKELEETLKEVKEIEQELNSIK